jgi:hypothetical protein
VAVELTKEQARLSGYVGIDAVEPLFAWLLDHPGGEVDLSQLDHLHTAVWQVLVAVRARIAAWPDDEGLKCWLMSGL